jgi:hypothetical protein
MRRTPLTMTADEKRDAILELWSGDKHYSSTEIGEFLGISKNSVIGIVNRARGEGDRRAVSRAAGSPLANKSSTYPPKPKVTDKRIGLRRKGFEEPARTPVPSKPEVKTLFNIGMLECHYPLNYMTSDGFQIYCGADARETYAKHKRAYCTEHHGRMYYKSRNYQPVKQEDRRNVFKFNFKTS